MTRRAERAMNPTITWILVSLPVRARDTCAVLLGSRVGRFGSRSTRRRSAPDVPRPAHGRGSDRLFGGLLCVLFLQEQETAPTRPVCSAAPGNALVLQSLSESSVVNLVVNGASLQLRGTLVVRTASAQTQFIALEGEARVLARGQEGVLRSGLQLDVPNSQGDFALAGGPPGEIRPLEFAAIAGLPVGLFDRPLHLPQPGTVTTFGAVNLRAAPDLQGALLASVASGETLTVLGRNPTGDWLHLRRENGQSGWMFAELLFQNLGEINAVYEATPLPPQRYGRLGGSGRVIAPTGVNLRRGPHVRFALLGSLPAGSEVTLLERSPYSPWVKIEYGEVVGWVLLGALQTDAWLPSLPLAAGVPQPPAPTRVPGSYDNAFPRGG